MKVDIPDSLIQECIDSNLIQTHGSVHSSEARGQQVQRLEYHIAEIVVAIIAKEMRNRKMLTYKRNG
jgi:hypothetical protein